MNRLSHASEEDLIAHQLGEHDDPAHLRQHLGQCSECATQANAIAESLRIFSGGAIPEPDLARNWSELRKNLVAFTPSPRRRLQVLLWPASGVLAAVLALAIFLTTKDLPLSSLRATPTHVRQQGPLSTTPANSEVARQLDSAERLLTEVNHASGPLDDTTRAQAHDLLLKNAVFIRSARQNGDFATASVLENLGRVLTDLDHQPETPRSGWHLRLEMNTEGLLLDIRILRQNDSSL